MADDGHGAHDRITHSQVITSTLVTVGYPETLDRDLDFCADVLTRAVGRMKRHEQSVNFNDVTEKERLRAIFVLNTMYEVEKKLKAQEQQQHHSQQQMQQQQSQQFASASRFGGAPSDGSTSFYGR